MASRNSVLRHVGLKMCALGLAIGVLVGVVAGVLLPEKFTSEASVQLLPSEVPARQRLSIGNDPDRFMNDQRLIILSNLVLERVKESFPDLHIRTLRKRIEVETPRLSGVLTISASAESPFKAKAILTATIAAFNAVHGKGYTSTTLSPPSLASQPAGLGPAQLAAVGGLLGLAAGIFVAVVSSRRRQLGVTTDDAGGVEETHGLGTPAAD